MDSQIEQIKRTLNLLFQPGDTIELRCVGDRTINGFYRDTHKLAQDAHDLNSNFSPLQNTYVCLNPVRSDLYARRPDQFSYAQKGESVKDCDISCRRWLLIDIDPIRPTGVSATSEQKQAAIEVAKTVYGWLQDQLGATCIICADSGNGGHMLIRLRDVFANDETRWVCERFLQMLSDQFSTDQAKVDLTTFNSSRICTIYGTIKRKGSDIPEQPHRLSKLLHVPDPLQPVDWQRLASLADPYPGEQQAAPQPAGPTWDVDALLRQHELRFSRDDNYRTNSGDLATRFELEICPFNAEHNDRSAVILQWQNGAVCFKCHHDGCAGKGWRELKQLWGLPDGNGITTEDIILPSPPAQQQSELVIVRSQDVETESIAWLEQDRFVIGGINLCAGRGGIGKTYFLCDLVARITNSALSAPTASHCSTVVCCTPRAKIT